MGKVSGDETSELNTDSKGIALESAPDPKRQTRIEQAETRTEQAEARTEQANTRTEQAETRTERAETRTEQAQTRTEQAETRTEEAEARMEQAESRTEKAETQREQAMRASELSYRRLFEAARDGILILDVDTGRITDVNPFLTELLGFSHAEMVGKTVGELSPFKDIESNKVLLGRLQRDGYVRYEDLPLETRNGDHVAVEFVSNVYQAGDKKVIQCNIRDITERKQAELASIRLAAIIESSDDAIIGKDLNGVITSWNKGAEQIFGYSATEMIGTSIMRLIPADRQDEANQILGKIRSGKNVEHFETLRQTKDGRLIDVSVTASAIKDATGKVIGVSKVARNITERKRAEKKMHNIQAQLEQTNRNLTKRSQEIQYFYHTLSHELKTPLTAAREFVSIVIDGLAGELNATQLNYLGIAKKSCSELAVYINDLLDATRLDTGKLHVELKAVSLAAIIQRAIAVMEPVAARKNIRLSEDLNTDLTDVMVDESRIMQILTNLLNNALKFTFEGGAIIVKLAECSKSSECVQISVTDNGCGIPKDKIDNLFHRFYQIKNGDATPEKGVGLGLYLCRELVLMHGGSIWVESALGKGSTFSFTIPKHAATKASHVLVVDDDNDVCKALRLALEDNGFDVETVAGGSEALQRIGRKTPDVVVLDLMMVGLDGPSTLKEIRRNLGPIPVIVHTGYPDGDLMQRALESSPFTLLAKPCPPKRFVETVRRICHQNQPVRPPSSTRTLNEGN
ncbi:MAG TPA: PAS domain S-box protein [Chthoniobacterales bacterium]|jgi:PAS domain S-box-containing protein|nr:PAS domain S-box protein [Chthoniobacterales bacterium]